MKRLWKNGLTGMTLAVFVITSMLAGTAYGAGSLAYQTQSVAFSGGTRTVQVIWADLNDPGIKVQVAVANNTLQTVAPLNAIAESVRTAETGELAAINGAFFEAYQGTNIFYGILENNGQYIKTGGNEVVMGFSADNQVKMGEPRPKIEMTREGEKERNPYSLPWPIWALNHTFNTPGEMCIYTSFYGSYTPATSATSVVVRNGTVVQIVDGSGPIYADGFTIASNGNPITDFAVGDNLSYTIGYEDMAWERYNTKVAAGPIIIENSIIRTDYAQQGYFESKILTDSGQRSFMGVTADNKLFIGTVGSVTVAQLAEIALNMGAVNALNLDGGASSGLYYDGNYKTVPGRNLAGVIVVTTANKPEAAVNSNSENQNTGAGYALAVPTASPVLVDGKTVAFDAYTIDNNNYFKLRDIAMAVKGSPKQFEVAWDESKNAINLISGQAYTVAGGELAAGSAGNKTAALSSAKIYLNGQEVRLTAYNVDGNNYIKLRDLGETFDFSVTWDGSANTIKIDTANGYLD